MTNWHLSRFGSIKERLLAGKSISGECWIWNMSATRDGYGVMAIKGRQHRVHRVSYQEFIGPIPNGQLVCHKCDTPLCFNPHHLFLGSCADNSADMADKGRRYTTVGDLHPMAKVSSADVPEIRRLRASGETLKNIGEKFGITFQTVSLIARGKRWAHI